MSAKRVVDVGLFVLVTLCALVVAGVWGALSSAASGQEQCASTDAPCLATALASAKATASAAVSAQTSASAAVASAQVAVADASAAVTTAQNETAAEKSKRLIRYGVTAGLAGPTLYFRSKDEGAATGIMPFVVLLPAFWVNEAAQSSYCAAEWSAPKDEVQAAADYYNTLDGLGDKTRVSAAANENDNRGQEDETQLQHQCQLRSAEQLDGLVTIAAALPDCQQTRRASLPNGKCEAAIMERMLDLVCEGNPSGKMEETAPSAAPRGVATRSKQLEAAKAAAGGKGTNAQVTNAAVSHTSRFRKRALSSRSQRLRARQPRTRQTIDSFV